MAVWVICKSKLTDHVVRRISWPSERRGGFLVLIGSPRPELLPALERRFNRVVFATNPGNVLPKEELEAVLKLPERKDRFIGGMVDKESRIVTLWRGDLTPLVVPFSAFPATANGTRPDFDQFAVTDYGHTLRFGGYEAAADAVLYEYDPDFRRRQNRARRENEQTLGASIRRLRKQRQLTRHDFPRLDPKTIARIERGQVGRPQTQTLKLIAKRLGVAIGSLGSF